MIYVCIYIYISRENKYQITIQRGDMKVINTI